MCTVIMVDNIEDSQLLPYLRLVSKAYALSPGGGKLQKWLFAGFRIPRKKFQKMSFLKKSLG